MKIKNKIKMKIIIILGITAFIAGSCNEQATKKYVEITLQELNTMYDTHTTNHTIYFGSDSAYLYFGQSNLKGTKNYNLKKQELALPSEFPLSENRKPVLLLEMLFNDGKN
jgi:hypothetical protein